MQIDTGFGDIKFSNAQTETIDSLLDFESPSLLCYPKGTVIAEKFEAMIMLDLLNSRMKDFFDIWMLLRSFRFDVTVLAKAIQSTLENRETKVPKNITAFSDKFVNLKQKDWEAFLRRS